MLATRQLQGGSTSYEGITLLQHTSYNTSFANGFRAPSRFFLAAPWAGHGHQGTRIAMISVRWRAMAWRQGQAIDMQEAKGEEALVCDRPLRNGRQFSSIAKRVAL